MGRRSSSVAILALAVLGSALVLGRTAPHGSGVTSDSVNYLVSAKSLATSGDLLTYGGKQLVDWPPLFPALVALSTPTDLEGAASAARWLNAACFFGITAVAGCWLGSLGLRRGVVIAGTAAVAIGPPLLSVASFVWSEPLFILLSVLGLRALARASRPASGLRWVAAAGALVALTALTRYIGVVLILTGVVTLLAPAGRSTRSRLVELGLFVTIAAGPLAAWVLRNLAVADSAAGKRAISVATPQSVVSAAVDTIGGWIAPRTLPGGVRIAVIAAVVVSAIVVVAGRRARSADDRAGARPALVPAALFVSIFGAVTFASEMTSRVDAPNDRILSPIFVPLVVLAMVGVNAGFTARLAGAVLTVWLGALVATAAVDYSHARQQGAGGYSSRRWRDSALIASLRQRPPETPGYTNVPAAVYYLTGQHLVRLPAPPSFGGEPDAIDDLQALARTRAVSLVWFDRAPRDTYRPHDLEAHFRLVTERAVADGTVYRLEAR